MKGKLGHLEGIHSVHILVRNMLQEFHGVVRHCIALLAQHLAMAMNVGREKNANGIEDNYIDIYIESFF